MSDIKIENGRISVDLNLYDLLADNMPEGQLPVLADALSVTDEVITHVMNQVFDGCTEFGSSGSELLGDDDAMTPLQQFRRRIAKEAGDVACREIERLEQKNRKLNMRLDEVQNDLVIQKQIVNDWYKDRGWENGENNA